MQRVEHERPQRYRALTRANIRKHPIWQQLDAQAREAIEVVSAVLPFKTNAYVVEQLIDWSRVPADPIYQLTFGQPGMLDPRSYARVAELLRSGDPAELDRSVRALRLGLNPHPAGQLTHNVPSLEGQGLEGLQHKYRETVLFFPAQGQTCHAYCSFCFRWAQFVGLEDMKFEARESTLLAAYLRQRPEVSDLLVTGGDPLVMHTRVLRRYLEPLLAPEFAHLHLRVGTKSLAYWPQRFVSDADADELLRLFEAIVASGRHLALMAHCTHPREFDTPIAERAIARVRSTGAVIRMQSPVLRHINDDAETWASLWRAGVRRGCVPYYMFVERDTGPCRYFELPLVRAWEIFSDAYRRVSGLCRTVRGPSMSTHHGKVSVDGVVELGAGKAFVLRYLQARDPNWVGQPFFAKFNPEATWLSELEPVFEHDAHFFSPPSAGLDPEHRLPVVG